MAQRKRRLYQFTTRSLLLLTLVLCCLFAWLHNRHERWRREVINLESKWELVECEPSVAPHCVSFNQGTYTCNYNSDLTTEVGKYTLDPLGLPKQIDIIDTSRVGVRLKGLYQIDSDRLTIVRSDPNENRPQSLDAKTGDTKMVYRRIHSSRE